MELKNNENLKSVLLGLLKRFIQICSTYNLSYYCSAGTALGAIRHQGFIPWDDDIDVVMFRPDYDRFVEIVNSLHDEKLEIIEMHHSQYYHLPYAKLCDKNTTLIENKYGRCVYGLYLDIFPLDGVSGKTQIDSKLYFKYNNYSHWLLDVESYWKIQDYWYQFTKCKIKQVVKMLCISLFRNPIRNYIKMSIDLISHTYDVPSSASVINYIEYYGFEKAVFPKEWFGSGRKAMFEEIEVVIPTECEKYLSRMYGDYMQLPPVEKRYSHHSVAYVNLIKRESYKEIAEKVNRF